MILQVVLGCALFVVACDGPEHVVVQQPPRRIAPPPHEDSPRLNPEPRRDFEPDKNEPDPIVPGGSPLGRDNADRFQLEFRLQNKLYFDKIEELQASADRMRKSVLELGDVLRAEGVDVEGHSRYRQARDSADRVERDAERLRQKLHSIYLSNYLPDKLLMPSSAPDEKVRPLLQSLEREIDGMKNGHADQSKSTPEQTPSSPELPSPNASSKPTAPSPGHEGLESASPRKDPSQKSAAVAGGEHAELPQQSATLAKRAPEQPSLPPEPPSPNGSSKLTAPSSEHESLEPASPQNGPDHRIAQLKLASTEWFLINRR